jgi:chromosome segregation and condensation protein ScpB
MQDSQFDVPLRELLESGLVRKVGNIRTKGNFMYYELVQKK